MPLKSLEEQFNVTITREVVQYRDSSDQKVAKAGIQVRTGEKQRAGEAVDEAEAGLHHKRSGHKGPNLGDVTIQLWTYRKKVSFKKKGGLIH